MAASFSRFHEDLFPRFRKKVFLVDTVQTFYLPLFFHQHPHRVYAGNKTRVYNPGKRSIRRPPFYSFTGFACVDRADVGAAETYPGGGMEDIETTLALAGRFDNRRGCFRLFLFVSAFLAEKNGFRFQVSDFKLKIPRMNMDSI